MSGDLKEMVDYYLFVLSSMWMEDFQMINQNVVFHLIIVSYFVVVTLLDMPFMMTAEHFTIATKNNIIPNLCLVLYLRFEFKIYSI